MAFSAYIAIKGLKLGQFKAEATTDQRKDKWIPILAFTQGVISPRDPATGLPTGKRQHQPVTIVKPWGAASPQGLTACATNEALSEVDLEFTRAGVETVYQTVKLLNASITQVVRFTGRADGGEDTPTLGHSDTAAMMEYERWSFTFRRIEVQDIDGKTIYADDVLTVV
jgi:type VI secretion system secreted protein Hcp